MEDNCEICNSLNISKICKEAKRRKSYDENKVLNFHAEIMFFSNIENKRVKYSNSQLAKSFKVINTYMLLVFYV